MRMRSRRQKYGFWDSAYLENVFFAIYDSALLELCANLFTADRNKNNLEKNFEEKQEKGGKTRRPMCRQPLFYAGFRDFYIFFKKT